MPGTLRWLLLLTALVALFFWKVLFTNQFSLLLNWEGTNQTYAWYNFAAQTIQQGTLPAWDPYSQSGRSFVGESQTGLFYPLKALLYLAPLGPDGLVSERIFHQFFVLAHLLAAFFMFLCAREVGIKNGFAAFIAAACFSLGGFTGRVPWPYMLDSAIWLPLIFLLLLRAFRAGTRSKRIAYAGCCGLALGMTLLAGSIHVLFMDVLVVLSAAGLFTFRSESRSAGESTPATPSPAYHWLAAAWIILLVGVVAVAASAVQLLPSLEYAPLARRWTGEWSGAFQERIPYEVAGNLFHMTPRAIFTFLFGGTPDGGAEISPYFGVMPLLLTIIGMGRNWSNRWVKYLAVLALLAFLMALGDYSLLHGLSYLLIPYFDKLWEAGRFIYLTHFAMALLAGFGVQSLLSDDTSATFYQRLHRLLGWIVAVALFVLGIAALLGTPAIGEWPYVSLFFLLTAWGAFWYILRGNRQVLFKILLLAVIVSDLYAFNWTFPNRLREQRANADHLEAMKSLRPVANYLHSQPGLFRVDFDGDFSPRGMGDVFGISTTGGAGVTMLEDYWRAMSSPHARCLLNVRYIIGAGTGRTEAPVFTSGPWKVYEVPAPCPRAWVVQEAVVESPDEVRRRITEESLDPLRVAYLSEPLGSPLDAAPGTPASIAFGSYQPNRIELHADVSAAGLLVLSEIYYPGWRAAINNQPAPVYKVDSILRGVVVSPGSNHIVMEYRPASIRVGAALSLLAFLGTFLFAAIVLRRDRAASPQR